MISPTIPSYYSRIGRHFGLVVVAFLGCQQAEEADDGPFREVTVVASATVEPKAPSQPKVVSPEATDEQVASFVPEWIADAIFYQIFPERFCNGDPTNDPTRESLESPDVPETWEVTPWTSDWYSRLPWEKQLGLSFYDGVFHRRYGGDLQGVLDKLDYLQQLGINAIYFNPVFYGRSLHKYDGASMHHIDPYFGPDPQGDLAVIATETSDPSTWQWTAADKLFLQLVKELHRREMRVIIDGVFNHTGRDFFAFADLRERQQESPYQDWYIVQHFDDPETPHNEFRYKSWWGFESLPEFADSDSQQDLHPGPKQYVMNITKRWMDPNNDGDPGDGIDGWRLDVANEVPPKFWKEWNTLVRELNPEAYTVGEFWGDAKQHLLDGHFSGTMNYHGFAYLVKGFLIDGRLTAHDFGKQLQERRTVYPEPMQFALQNLIDSHDTDRVASMIVNTSDKQYHQADRFDFDVSEVVSPRSNSEYNVSAPTQQQRRIQRLVAVMQMTALGAPMVYYGTEAGMWGADDPCDRKPMVWQDQNYKDESSDPLGRSRTPDPVAFDQDLYEFYSRVIHLRQDSKVLRHGTMEVIAHDDDAQFIAFRRVHEGESVIVLINRGSEAYGWKGEGDKWTWLKSLLLASDPGASQKILQQGELSTLMVPALDAWVLAETLAEE